MADKVINLSAADQDSNIECHLMPCRIEHSGTSVKAKEYFWPTIRPLESDTLDTSGDSKAKQKRPAATDSRDEKNEQKTGAKLVTASFRGRPLQGRRLELPMGYQGHVLKVEGACGNGSSIGGFREFTYWNWDELPTDQDSVVKSLQWISISKAIHDQ